MTTRDSWQDPLTHFTTVPASKVVQASEVIRGLAGSWAASYATDIGMQMELTLVDPKQPAPYRLKASRLGQPGHPEINFTPYCFGTNQFGPKGGALIGHPISFSVVGPTLKNPEVDWQWEVDSSGTADTLTLTLTVLHPGETIATLYGISTLNDYPGGLYLVVSMTGSEGTLGGAAGGLGDGIILDQTPLNAPCVPLSETSKCEIFRVTRMDGTKLILTLDSSKRLATYFTIPPGPAVPFIRAVTLLQPAATRLVAIPGMGETRGQEQTFAVVPPATALNGDLQYPLATWNHGGVPGTWYEDGLQDFLMVGGNNTEYNVKPKLPIPRPIGSERFLVMGGAIGPFEALEAGRFKLESVLAPLTNVAEGDILHIYDVSVAGAAELRAGATTGRQASINSLLGWFEVIRPIVAGVVILRRMEEVDPTTGRNYIGSWSSLSMAAAPTATDYIELSATIHRPVSTLWYSGATTDYPDIDAMVASRLTNIIDPSWVERTIKVTNAATQLGASVARSDRAIFDTASSSTGTAGSNANPGSLLDLGFRMVLFPAKAQTIGGITLAGPDWDRPITSTEVLLDPTKPTEKQYIEIDYSNGLIHLSHEPQSGSAVWPGSMAGVLDNPRGELVLFACCVPYSMEEGQLGSSVRVTASATGDNLGVGCQPNGEEAELRQTDVYSSRVYAPLANQTITSGHDGLLSITLTNVSRPIKPYIPNTGFVELLAGTDPTGTPILSGVGYRGSVFSYCGVDEDLVLDTTTLLLAYGGGQGAAAFVVDDANPVVAVWRREATLPQTNTGLVGLDYAYDTTYGGAKRSKALRFRGADLQSNPDGTLTVAPNTDVELSHSVLFRNLFSSGLISGCTLGAPVIAATITVPYSGGSVLANGIQQLVVAGEIDLPGAPVDGTYYLYLGAFSGSNPCYIGKYKLTQPLTSMEDILLAKVVVSGGGLAAAVLDLRYPLADIDRRMDIYVGEQAAGWPAPYFATLAEAVDYANEYLTPSAGTSIRKIRIFVAGRTVETNYPIVIRSRGITIESINKETGVAPYADVCWGGGVSREALFDLNSCDDFTLKNLGFRCLDAPPLVPDTDGAFVVRYDAVGLSADNLVIENCRLLGGPDGLLTIQAGTINQARIQNNVGSGLYTSGIMGLTGGTAIFSGCQITDNTFIGQGHRPTEPGIYIPSALGCGDNTVVRNSITAFDYGIKSLGLRDIVDYNWVSSTKLEGIWTVDAASTSYNCLTECFDPAPLVPVLNDVWVQGLLATGTTAGERRVHGNYVMMMATLSVPVARHPKAAIRVTGDGASISDNKCFYDPANFYEAWLVAEDDHHTITGNQGALTIWGWGNKLVGNRGHRLTVNWDQFSFWSAWPPGSLLSFHSTADAIPNLLVENNFTADETDANQPGVVALAAYTRAVNNRFRMATDETTEAVKVAVGAGTYIDSNSVLIGNRIGHLKDFTNWGAHAPTGFNQLTDNDIDWVGETAGGAWDQTLAGGFLHVTGNAFQSGLKLPGADRSVITGNRSLGTIFEIGAFGGWVSTVTVSDNLVYSLLGVTSLAVWASSGTVSGNWVGLGTMAVVGTNLTITGNNVTNTGVDGPLSVTGSGLSVSGNYAEQFNLIALTSSGFTGNVSASHITVVSAAPGDSADLTITGNMIVDTAAGILTVPANAARVTVGGNRAYDVSVGSASSVVQGNTCTDLTVTGAGCPVFGNIVSDDFTVGENADGCSVFGNIVGDDLIVNANAGTGKAPAGLILIGNWVTGVILNSNPPIGWTYCSIGNRALSIFTVAQVNASVDVHSFKDV